MKYARQCPKCGSREIWMYVNDGYPDGSVKGIKTGQTIFSHINVERYICCNCGYTEDWVSRRDIEALKGSSNGRRVNQ